ncbi:MerR family transcriptional regulator [Deinococcus yavapaiensis]|uniref:DNA-binding transcriptional MerR regulator n=1 Tax=Deinococcus yavapaiensis KR-236 TaxID=694435 RepID=A0A318SLB9_9DEIO|nr:MerR family transcriptional regulator [Deinococcus yavapaiensis]PYE53342.1 DNA-binding transcriptional MerR regulator [Deinococcus yavapaiensis KR-236]
MSSHPTKALLPIGSFAREARLSRKALRLYDALGLLTPAFVDDLSGYRYYASEQVGRAKLIGLLRQLGMPLPRIADLLDLTSERAAKAVAAYWSEVEQDHTAKRQLASYLENFLQGKDGNMFDIKTRSVAQRHVVTLTKAVYVKDLGAFIDSAHRDLYSLVARCGARAGETSFVIYHGGVNDDGDGPVEVCVPFEGEIDARGDARTRIEPAHTEVYTTLTKGRTVFPGILEAYDAVHAYTERHGLRRRAAPREVYFASGSEIGDDDPFCDVAWPVE